MNDFKQKSDANKGSVDEVGKLIRHVGAREAVAPERFDRAHKKVLEHWEQVVAEQRQAARPNRFTRFAVAASMLMVAGLVTILWNQRDAGPAGNLAKVDRVVGTVMVEGSPLTDASHVKAGAVISTGQDGRVALRMADGQSLRLDTSTDIRIVSASRLALRAGAIFVDSDFAEPQASIQVQTPLGVASDIGTRFQVRLRDDVLIVGVADGLVKVAHDDGPSHAVDRGYSLALDAAGGAQKSELDDTSQDWAWVDTIVPEFNIEGATLEQYLRWYAHERGLELQWSDRESQINARNTGLSGSIQGADLDESLELVKRIAPFRHEVTGDRLLVAVE
ncbi:MAG: FecR family protein [Gammaproteobacteria bacterium]|nr:FecR family protein [Gammaproteobacteria bacterium]